MASILYHSSTVANRRLHSKTPRRVTNECNGDFSSISSRCSSKPIMTTFEQLFEESRGRLDNAAYIWSKGTRNPYGSHLGTD